MELRRAWMREPPVSWFLSGYFKYEPPTEATKRLGQKSISSWSKAVENTLRMGEMLAVQGSIKG